MQKRPQEAAQEAPAPKKLKADTKKQNKPKTKLQKPTGGKPQKSKGKSDEKPEDWNVFKQKKKELKLKRKQQKPSFDAVTKAKQIGEKLRRKILKGGLDERNGLINQLHSLLKDKDLYQKFVLAHDTSRIVQWLLKYSSETIKDQVSQELLPVIGQMFQSKYGIFCVKRLLKYGNSTTKSDIVKSIYGSAVKFSSHSISAPVLEFAYTTCATPLQKTHLIQEFFGDLYKNSKDDSVRHLRDVYSSSNDLKQGTLSATKANLMHVINKNLLDSTLVQTVLYQYLNECNSEDKIELIQVLIPHIVVISNSKDGARVAMQCLWHGSNKDRKSAIKIIKEHVLELAKHEHGHCTVITLLDSIDDTVLLNKAILSVILKSAKDLASNEWGRKVLLWLVAPAETTFFHPVFVKELEEGRAKSSAKKASEIRRNEILNYSIKSLIDLIAEEPEFWLSNCSLAYEALAVIKAGSEDLIGDALKAVVNVIVQPDWTVKVNETDVLGVEEPGLHMVLKKLAKIAPGFSTQLVETLQKETKWLGFNRGCFLLVHAFENSAQDVQEQYKVKLQPHLAILKKQKTAGAKLLLKKLEV